jgi:hypothetical protein
MVALLMRNGNGKPENVTLCELAPAVVANLSATGYSKCIGGKTSTTTPVMTVSTLAARIGQRNAAEMALRFKAIKMGATATQVNLWSLDEVFLFIENHA